MKTKKEKTEKTAEDQNASDFEKKLIALVGQFTDELKKKSEDLSAELGVPFGDNLSFALNIAAKEVRGKDTITYCLGSFVGNGDDLAKSFLSGMRRLYVHTDECILHQVMFAGK